MSGHSKWASIKHSKGKADKQRSKIFSKLSKEISVAAKLGDKDPAMNPRLRSAIQAAKSANMPKDNIERAIKRASDKSIGDFKEILFEGYGPSGIAIIVETASDNNNRTVANVRSYFNKYGGNLGTAGSVEFMFDRVCNFTIKTDVDLEELELDFIDFGVDEVMKDDDGDVVLYSSFENYGSIQKEIESRNIEIISSEFERIPKQMKELNEELKKEVNILIEKIEEDDDVQTVFHNMNLN